VTQVLAVDIGSSSARAQVFDDTATPAGELAQSFYEPPPRDADGLVALTRSLIERAGPANVVSVSCFWHSLLVLDRRGRPLGPISGWLDLEAAAEARELGGELDAAAVHRRTGAPLHASFWPAKLRRLARDGFRPARVVSFSDYLQLRVTGELATSSSIASGTGLFDVHLLRWDPELLAALGLDESHLPPIVDEPVGAWRPALGDGAAANLGAGCTSAERACLTIGTSGAYRVVRAGDAEPKPGLFLYRVDRGRVIEGGALSDGGNLLVWLARTFGVTDADLDRPTHDLSFLPLLGGERSTGWNSDARGTLAGLSLGTTPADILQAAQEGIAYRFAEIADLVPGVEEIVGTGAALLARPSWAQLLADALERPVTLFADEQASLRGAAVAAVATPGLAPLGARYEPRADRADVHRAARERQRALYRATVAEETS
jgi:gluconokinase